MRKSKDGGQTAMKGFCCSVATAADRAVTKQRLGDIFIETWDKADMSANIKAGYRLSHQSLGYYRRNIYS